MVAKMKLIETVITSVLSQLFADDPMAPDNYYTCGDALRVIKKWIDLDGAWTFAKNHDVLVNNSSEDFMIQYMTEYNNEVGYFY